MTLLESLIAFVLLSVVGVACLDLTRGASSLERRSAGWTEAVATGEAALAAVVAGAPLTDAAFRNVQVSRTPWRADEALLVVDVRVTLPDGQTHHASRLMTRAAR